MTGARRQVRATTVVNPLGDQDTDRLTRLFAVDGLSSVLEVLERSDDVELGRVEAPAAELRSQSKLVAQP
jgi:hypothetical protein